MPQRIGTYPIPVLSLLKDLTGDPIDTRKKRVNRHPKEPRLQGKPALKVTPNLRHVGSGGEREVQVEVTGAKVWRQGRPRNMASPGRKRVHRQWSQGCVSVCGHARCGCGNPSFVLGAKH